MPFKSESQRRYMWKNHPKIAKKWAHKYDSKPKNKSYPKDAVSMARMMSS